MADERKADLSGEPGIRNAARIFGEEAAKKIADSWADQDPAFARAICNYAYGFMYSREILSQKQRELCAVAVLTALDKQAALAFHVRAAHLHGATREEIAEAICQAHLYAGIPCTMNGLETWRKVFREIDA